ncbi:hypothetical protein [Gracilimonas sp.]|uniref:hypothetical protein n=1 Tax=Gracilimonas sp. TaxID=1974203 RepID=UPI002871C019|nr:hypothetical protein [Gracilimonas sp.]
MFCRRGTNLSHDYTGILIGILVLLITACSDNSTNSNGDSSTQALTIEAEVPGYELGAQDLYQSEDFVDLIEGSIDEEGTLTVNFLSGEAIAEALKPLADDTDVFVGMYCREEIMGQVDSNHLFVDVNLFNFTYGEDNNTGAIGLSSNMTNRNVYPPQSDTKGDYQVRWIYASQEITISENCQIESDKTEEVNVEFTKGWNEVIFDVSDRDNKKMYTGNRPSGVNWVIGT